MKTPRPACLLRSFGDISIDLELRVWINDPENGVANELSEVQLLVWRKFQINGLEIPFPKRDVNFKGSLELKQ